MEEHLAGGTSSCPTQPRGQKGLPVRSSSEPPVDGETLGQHFWFPGCFFHVHSLTLEFDLQGPTARQILFSPKPSHQYGTRFLGKAVTISCAEAGSLEGPRSQSVHPDSFPKKAF